MRYTLHSAELGTTHVEERGQTTTTRLLCRHLLTPAFACAESERQRGEVGDRDRRHRRVRVIVLRRRALAQRRRQLHQVGDQRRPVARLPRLCEGPFLWPSNICSPLAFFQPDSPSLVQLSCQTRRRTLNRVASAGGTLTSGLPGSDPVSSGDLSALEPPFDDLPSFTWSLTLTSSIPTPKT